MITGRLAEKRHYIYSRCTRVININSHWETDSLNFLGSYLEVADAFYLSDLIYSGASVLK